MQIMTMMMMMMAMILLVVVEVTCAELVLGSLVTRAHRVAGDVVVLSERVLEIRGFVYDGAAPAVYFWADTNANPSSNGFPLYDGTPTNGCGRTPLQNAADGTATYRVEFPDNSSILDILGGSISVWCEEFSANFGEVRSEWSGFGIQHTERGEMRWMIRELSKPLTVGFFSFVLVTSLKFLHVGI
jgi:Electron transfer DM13